MSEVNHSRRGFLRGKVRPSEAPLRPPWARPETEFLDRCTRCGDCAPACPERIIELHNSYPQINFSIGACTFCGHCVSVCRSGALHREAQQTPWPVKAKVTDACLAQRGVECRICGDHCDESAIRFFPRLGGQPLPEINAAACTGCGACIAICPEQALVVR